MFDRYIPKCVLINQGLDWRHSLIRRLSRVLASSQLHPANAIRQSSIFALKIHQKLSIQVSTLPKVALLHVRRKNFALLVAVPLLPPPQNVAPTHTLMPQQDPTAHISPAAQLELSAHSARPAHGVLPSTQNPVSSVVLAHTQLPPGPHGPNVVHVWPVQAVLVQAPLTHVLPVGHCLESVKWYCINATKSRARHGEIYRLTTLPHDPQLFTSVWRLSLHGFSSLQIASVPKPMSFRTAETSVLQRMPA